MTWWCAAWNPATGMPSRSIYREGIDTGTATFTTSVPSAEKLDAQWLPDHRWVAEIDGRVERLGRASARCPRETATAGSPRTPSTSVAALAGAAWASCCFADRCKPADASEIWTVQSSIFPENRASVALHQAVGFPSRRHSLAYRSTGWAVA